MKSIAKLLSFALIGLIVQSCTNVDFQSEYDNHIDFTAYQTYAICTDDLETTDTEHVQFDNSENRIRISEAMVTELNRIGYREDAENPQLEAGFNIVLNDQQVEVKSCGSEEENEYWSGCRIDIHEYTEGTLVLRLTDLEKSQVIWEGSAKGVLISDQKKLLKIIDQTIEQLFSTFPIKSLDIAM